LNPETFKRIILQDHPNDVTKDGIPYKNLNAYDLTNRIVSKYPDNVVDGYKYSEFLPEPRNRKEQFIKTNYERTPEKWA
jgi:hypothetical protein